MTLNAPIDPDQLFNIRGKVAIITGAGRGLGRVIPCQTRKLVGSVIFLCSSASAYMTGESIVLDGAFSLT